MALLSLAGCRSKADKRPDLILILVDTLRADHLHAYGYPRETSPALDALAARGVLFEQAISAAPWTLPSSMSILTGRLPSHHRLENDGLKLSAGIPTLPEVLRGSGYATAAVVSHIYVGRPFGFDRGFDRFEDFGLSQGYRFEASLEPHASAVTDAALRLAQEAGDKPLFLLAHYFDPHWDYDPPAPYAERFATPYSGSISGKYSSFSEYARPDKDLSEADLQHLRDLYDGEIAYTDAEIGRLLDSLERVRGNRARVVTLVADHGEEFKEHRSLGHGRNLYDEVVRVPLIVADSRAAQPRKIGAQVSSVDLMPTLCVLAEVPPPRGVDGTSLAPLLAGQSAPARAAVSETIRFDAYRKSYRLPDAKLIVSLENNGRELYSLAQDPGEQTNLWARQGEQALALERALFDKVEVLPGGWSVRWSSDGKPHRFSGSLETDGQITGVVPLFPQVGRHRVTRGKRIDFDLEGVDSGGGLSFSVEPPDARVGFALAVDGKEDSAMVFAGSSRLHPPQSPFSFAGPPPRDLTLRPEFHTGKEIGFFLWRTPGASPEEAAELTEAARERLRSLGYVR
ncbi:MAG TPA: sulfatase [Candidatus Polarisedimenticolia bacterium]|nr:sulfatase [Candidatus Polarisedimenticolia bacterium]